MSRQQDEAAALERGALGFQEWYGKTVTDESMWIDPPDWDQKYKMYKTGYQDYSRNFQPAPTGLGDWSESDAGRFLAENMKYLMDPQFKKATESMYSRGLGRSTLYGEAMEPIQRASVSGLGDVLNDLYFRGRGLDLEQGKLDLARSRFAWEEDIGYREIDIKEQQASKKDFDIFDPSTWL